jgi:hypothetical protein
MGFMFPIKCQQGVVGNSQSIYSGWWITPEDEIIADNQLMINLFIIKEGSTYDSNYQH